MHRFAAKSRRLAAAVITVGALLVGSVAVAPSATAARGSIWADVYYRAGCSTGGFTALITGPSSPAQGWQVSGMRYYDFAGGDRFAHGAWMSHIGSVMVQPQAKVSLVDSNGTMRTFPNDTNGAQCYKVDARFRYETLVISEL